MLEFSVSEEELFTRLKSRGRADDTEEVIHNRMKVYADETRPLLEYYSSNNLQTVDAIGGLDEVFAPRAARTRQVADDHPAGAAHPQGGRAAHTR